MTSAAGSLDFLPRADAQFAERCAELARGAARGLIVHPWSANTRTLADWLTREVPGLRLRAHTSQARAEGAPAAAKWDEVDAVVFDSAPGELAADLLQLVDLPGLRVLAPLTDQYFRNRPLFLISIPKSGTHLLYKLAEVMGYARGIVHEEFPVPGQWYCVEYSNSHTVAKDFFVDTVRRAAYGNRYHAFTHSPAVFIYRHPLDVLVSEANYYHRDGKTAFAGYLAGLSFEQRAHRLLDDPWLLGSIRDRIGGFAPWLDFPNVVPVSFEELVGAEGGGTRDDQLRLIWSLQLKLQVPGSPQAHAAGVFDRDSPTFYQGHAGAWRSSLSAEHLARFRALSQDFMQAFGYDLESGGMPRRAAEFRKRPLSVPPPHLANVPIALEYNYLGFNLLRYAGWVYAVPQPMGPGFDIGRQPEDVLAVLPRDRDIPKLKHRLLLMSLLWGGNSQALVHDLCARLSGTGPRSGGIRRALGAAARGVLKGVARVLRSARGA